MAHRTLQKIIQETKSLYGFDFSFGCSTRRAATASATVEGSSLASAKPFEEMPSMPMLPLIGTAWLYFPIIGRYNIKKLHLANHEKHQRFGDVVREKVGKNDFVFSFRPEDLETLYKNEGPYPYRGEFLSASKVYRKSRQDVHSSLGLFFLDGKEWQDLRSKTQRHLLKPKAIQAYLEPMQEVAREFTQLIFELRNGDKEVPDLIRELNKWSLESVAHVGLDSRLGCLKRDLSEDSDGYKVLKSVETQIECMNKLEKLLGNIEFWKLFPTPTWKRFTAAADVFNEISFKYINQAVEDLKKDDGNEDKDLTLLQVMLATEGLSQADAVTMVADLISGGIETTSHTVAYLLYHLGRNPKEQEKLYQEIAKCLPTKEHKITPAVFGELRYLKASVKESQRLSPLIPGTGRMLANDAVLSGYRVPAGTFVVVILQGICQMEKYFRNAQKFIPERWLDKENKPHPFTFLPFGFGVRSCIGRRLAELEVICLVADIIRNFRVEYNFEEIGMISGLLNVPDRPLRINFIER